MSDQLETRAMADLILQIDSLREEKKNVAKDYQGRIDNLEAELTKLAIDAQSTQIRFDFNSGEVHD